MYLFYIDVNLMLLHYVDAHYVNVNICVHMLVNVAAQIVRTQNVKISKRKRYITYSVTKHIASQNVYYTKRKRQNMSMSRNVNVSHTHKDQLTRYSSTFCIN
jgi:hypothetical protein